MTLRGRTISRLAAPFEGGGGPTHSSIERIFISEDASGYLPAEGNKASRVLTGLTALRDGADIDGRTVRPDHEKLKSVAAELAEVLTDAGLVPKESVAEALTSPPSLSPSDESVRDSDRGSRVHETSVPDLPVSPDAPIFVVHGHDHALLHEAVRMLERSTSRDVVVLHEQPNAGRTLLEKFEEHATAAAYAVVLLTGDDVGGATGSAQTPRGRQNVIFELGFFFGKLGRARVAVLIAADVEQPSDISGLVYIPVDAGGAWKHRLGRELNGAGITVDHNRIP